MLLIVGENTMKHYLLLFLFVFISGNFVEIYSMKSSGINQCQNLIELSNKLSSRQKVEAYRVLFKKIDRQKLVSDGVLKSAYFKKAFEIIQGNLSIVNTIRVEGKKRDSWLAKIDEYKNLLHEIKKVLKYASQAGLYNETEKVDLAKVCLSAIELYSKIFEQCFLLQKLSLCNRCFSPGDSYDNSDCISEKCEKKINQNIVNILTFTTEKKSSVPVGSFFKALRHLEKTN